MKKIFKLVVLLLTLLTFPLFMNHCKSFQENQQSNKESLGIDFESFSEKYNENQQLQIVDTRTLDEYKSGHIPGALILPVQDLESSKDTSVVLSNLNKNREVYIYCSAGGPRSQRAALILRDMGFKKAYFIEGGIAQWIVSGNPVKQN